MNINGQEIPFNLSDVNDFERFDKAREKLTKANTNGKTKVEVLKKQNKAMAEFITDCVGAELYAKLVENKNDVLQNQSVFLALLEAFQEADRQTVKRMQEFATKYSKYLPEERR